MNSIDQAVMYVFAGNNGSGKSTFRNLIAEKQGIPTNIDPDSLAKKYTSNKEIRAGREAIRLIEELIRDKQDFSMETTLSGRLPLKQMSSAKENGFRIVVYYLGVEKIAINLNRIRQRVEQGGHNIPEEDVRRRENRSMSNLMNVIMIADEIHLIDNTYMQATIAASILKMEYKIHLPESNLPGWIGRVLKEIDQLKEKKDSAGG
ncbi:zeta toxin family protein [Sporosarcina aquimarina]|uniref:zeta toxin family protein n=1 Tax=Sporosarcina aquimarina TaxID=114975 RepID=UPI001C8CF85D|nr:zeta toxin family protein [Sporosarcina aquimarina]MBY0221660.1 zeta toxin family protein [Sporosarcina aquimarina]